MPPTELGTKLMVVIETKFFCFSCLSVKYVHMYVCIFTTCAIESQGYFCARLYLFYFVSGCMPSSVHQRIHNLLFINFNTVFVIPVFCCHCMHTHHDIIMTIEFDNDIQDSRNGT